GKSMAVESKSLPSTSRTPGKPWEGKIVGRRTSHKERQVQPTFHVRPGRVLHHSANITTVTADSPYHVIAYCRWSLRKAGLNRPGRGRPPGGTGASSST